MNEVLDKLQSQMQTDWHKVDIHGIDLSALGNIEKKAVIRMFQY